MRYSGFRVIREALRGHTGWGAAWRDAVPEDRYDFVVIGGGGHGLDTGITSPRFMTSAASR